MSRESSADKPLSVSLYARVSSERQAQKALSIPSQLGEMRKYAEEKGWMVVREYVDEAESARTANRPAFQEMLAAARTKNRPFDAILVWKLSRFARNREDSIIHKSLLRRRGVKVISITERVEDTPAGKAFEGMIEVIDEFYSANLAQDTIRGMREGARRGFFVGGSVAIGMKKVPLQDGARTRQRLEVDEIFEPTVRRIFDLYLAGQGGKTIASTLNSEGLRNRNGNPWTNTGVYVVLQNETYTGTFMSNVGVNRGMEPIRVPGAHRAIVTPEEFERVQRRLESRRPSNRHPRSVSSHLLLSGLAECGECGASMNGSKAKSGKYVYYGCRSYLKEGKAVCSSKQWSRQKLEDLVVEHVRDEILTRPHLEELARMVNDEIKSQRSAHAEHLQEIDGQLSDQRQRLDRVYNALEVGSLSVADLAPRLKGLRSSISQLEATRLDVLDKVNEPVLDITDPGTVAAYVKDLKTTLGQGTFMERKEFLGAFIKRVIAYRDHVDIEYIFPRPAEKGVGGEQGGAAGSPSDHGPERAEPGPVEAPVLALVACGSGGRT